MSVFYIRENKLNDKEFAELSMREMHETNIHCKRKSLFKYFPNTKRDFNGITRNYSIEALRNNTVYLANPREFDDPYDCNVFMDSIHFYLQRIHYYASQCGVDVNRDWDYAETARNLVKRIIDHLSKGNPISSLLPLNTENELVRAHQTIFWQALELVRLSPNANEESFYTALNNVINNEYNGMQKSADSFRVACFAQTPYSMLMWAHYANCHKGFCIEYETPMYSDDNANIYHNLYPVIYTDSRKDLSQLSINWNASGEMTNGELWDFYKYCLLSKSVDWKYQQEWRLLSCGNLITDDSYNCKFFKIKKVYLGNKMQSTDRREIIDICKSRHIPYVGVTISPDKFEMKDCENLCENCQRLKSE